MWIGVGDGQGVRRAWKDGVARQAENKDRHISLSSLPGVPCIGVAVCAKAGKGRALKERKGTLHSHSSDSDTKRKSSTRRSLAVVGGRTYIGKVKLYAENSFPFAVFRNGSHFGDIDILCN